MSNAAAPATEGPDRTDGPLHVAIIMDGNGRWAAAQRPFPSMMIATCKGPSVRSGPSVAGAAAFDIDQSLSLNGEDFLFLGRKQLIDFRNRPVGCLLHVSGQTFLIVFGNLVIFLQFLDRIEAIAA